MGHCINGFVFPAASSLLAPRRLEHSRAVPLPQGFAFLPLTEAMYDEITRFSAAPEPFKEFVYLSVPIAQLAEEAEEMSRAAALVYFETDYHGGVGTQAAALWRDGKLAAGPYFRWGRGPINKALRALGVAKGRWTQDRFAALGLGRYRSNEGWLDRGEPQ